MISIIRHLRMAPFTKPCFRIASLNARARLVANGQESSALLRRKQIDVFGVQEVKFHLPVSVQGYVWLPRLDRFIRPQHTLGIGVPVNRQVQGLLRIAAVDKLHEFM